jgi:hypothetical protein
MASLVPRRRAIVAGQVRSVVSYELPYLRTDAELRDGTGIVVLRFMGRASVPGVAVGRHLVAEGTPRPEHEALVMLNPRYWFEAGECAPSATSW